MRRLVWAAALRLLLACALGTLATWAVAVAAGSGLLAPAPTAFITDRDGGFLTQSGHESRRADGGRQVDYGYWPVMPPPRVVAATLALEDRRFWSHPGVDPVAVLRAAWQHVRGGGSGASTLAMQVVRMQHPRPRTLWAKAVEAGTAIVLTARYGHAAVLAQYLRLAPYGENSHGIAHAARWYFDQPAEDLSIAQAALLSAIPQAPTAMALHAGLHRAVARARRALAAMALSPADRTLAEADLDRLAPRPAPRRPASLQLALRLARSVPGGGMVHATIDGRVQRDVTRAALAHLDAWRRAGAQQVAVMVVRRGSREVLADVASAGYGSRPAGAIDYSAALRSPGSTLKPFLYALGLDRHVLAPEDVLADLPEGAAGISNADHDFLGPLLPRQALANSRNVPATNLLRRVGLAEGFGFLRTLGLHDLDGPAQRFGLAMAIGALPTSLDRLMRAYTTLAEDGTDAPLQWFTAPAEPPRPVISVDAARLVGRFLSDPLARLPSFPRYGSSEFPFAVALKTGTSQGYRDAWTLEWSRDEVVGVWLGRADAGPMAGLSGARAAAGLAQSIMLHLHGLGRADLVAGDFPAPPGREQAELCTGTGALADHACDQRLAEWVRPGGASPAAPPGPRLSIISPDPDTHVWRNPEAPSSLNRLVFRASVEPSVPQIVWLVDGQPVATAPPGMPFAWMMTPGHHRIQVRLPLQAGISRPLAVVVD
jgi:penicillin-binding protein 1C